MLWKEFGAASCHGVVSHGRCRIRVIHVISSALWRLPLHTQLQTFRGVALTYAKGQSRHFAPRKNSELFRHRTPVKSDADLPMGACYRSQ